MLLVYNDVKMFMDNDHHYCVLLTEIVEVCI